MITGMTQLHFRASLHRSFASITLRPTAVSGRRLAKRIVTGPVRAQKTETSNKESKDITETGGKVSAHTYACIDQLRLCPAHVALLTRDSL